jgi:hypothetical protein
MKNVNTSFKKVLSAVAVIAVLVLSGTNANANKEKTKSDSNRIPVEVKYVGTTDASPVLEFTLENESAEDLTVTLRDLEGNILYSGNFSDKKIAKKFQFDNHGLDPIKIKLTVSSKKGSQTEVYQINSNRQVIDEVVIAKM